MGSPARASEYLKGLPGPALAQAMWERYVTLVTEGTPTDRLLVMVDGPTRSTWLTRLKGLSVPTGGHWVVTPGAFIQQELRLWWGVAAKRLAALGLPSDGPAEPVFAAIDLAQYLMTTLTAHRRPPLLADAHSLPHFQNVQLLDALARGVEHRLSLEAAEGEDARRIAGVLDRRGRAIAAPCARLAGAIADRVRLGAAAPELVGEAAEAIALYLDGCLRAGVLDHALQLEVYTTALWPDPDYQAHLARRFDHLLVEKLDESTPRLQAFYEGLLGLGLQGFFTLQADAGPASHPFQGGLREYVGADPQGAWVLAAAHATEREMIVPAADDAHEPPLAPLGRGLLDGLLGQAHRVKLPVGRVRVSLDDYSPAEMLQSVAERLAQLLASGVAPREIALVSPTLSPLFIWDLRQRLAALDVPLYVFAGTNRLRDYRPVRVLITLAKLAHPDWNLPATRYELMELLELVTAVNPLQLTRVAMRLFPEGRLAEPSMVAATVPEIDAAGLKRYGALTQVVESWRLASPSEDLGRFFQTAFARVYALARAPQPGTAGADEAFLREISQIGQLIELAARFREVDKRLEGEVEGWALRFLAFLDESPIAERPFFEREPHDNAIMLATPSQMAEKGFTGSDESLAHMFWLDFGSPGWRKRDQRELTNARVLSARWAGGAYTLAHGEADMNEKLGRVLMACCLKVRERLWVHGCLTDDEGRENDGALPDLLREALGEDYLAARAR